ncbi:MAG: class IV adenylate cyclase [Candidatus Promineifilaceae bacterium]|nr:class IV adenylate cyclase [Candidatus Promineifilaceae bacterium]
MNAGADRLEIEVKFLVDDLETMRRRLDEVGARRVRERTHEYNIRYDNGWGGLQLQGKLLRLRQDTAAKITFKGEPKTGRESEARVREELEIEVQDFETMDAILRRVGFEAVQVYEKYRETYELGEELEVVLDELPYGNFVELEGEEAAIRGAADELGLDWERRILENYLALMERLKAAAALSFDDLTFENFADVSATLYDLDDIDDRS